MLPLNPPAERLGQENAVLSGRGAHYHVADFRGCLSIKSVVHGAAAWETARRRFLLNEGQWLILNDGQHYTITIDSELPATTFCLFFEHGFVEDIYRVETTSSGALLDNPHLPSPRSLDFFNRIEPEGTPLLSHLQRFNTRLRTGNLSRIEWDSHFLSAGHSLVLSRNETTTAISRLPSLRHSTRLELYRRVLQGRDFLLSHLSQPIQLKEMAAAACLSSFHFHRTFTRAFGETPHRYLTRHRLARAARLLRQSSLTVTEICLSTGFESVTSFSHLFRCHYGVPPTKISKIQEAQ